MKRLLIILSLFLLVNQLSAQRYTPMPTWYDFFQAKFHTLGFPLTPAVAGKDTGFVYYRKMDSTIQVWTGFQWITIGGNTTASNGLVKSGNDIRLGRILGTTGSELEYDAEIPLNGHSVLFTLPETMGTQPFTEISKRGIEIWGAGAASSPARVRLKDITGPYLTLEKAATGSNLGFGLSQIFVRDSDGHLVFTKTPGTSPTAFFTVDGPAAYLDTLTATTMGIADSSNRVATTAGVKRIIAAGGGGSQSLQQTTDIGSTTTNTIVTADVKYNGVSNYSEKRRATNLYGYRDSTGVKFAIPRPNVDGSGNVTWPIIGLDVGDTDHEPIGFTSAVANGSGQLELNYPTVKQVHNSVIVPDEQIVKLIGGIGASVGLSKSTFFVYRQATWGGQYAWNPTTQVWYNDGADINGSGATVTYSPDSGLVRITITSIMTSGSERDFKKFTANINRPDLDVFLRSDLSSNTVLCFQVTDRMGDVPPTYVFNGSTAINITGPTWPKQVPLNYMGGSAAWLQPFFTTAANFFIQQTHKLNQ